MLILIVPSLKADLTDILLTPIKNKNDLKFNENTKSFITIPKVEECTPEKVGKFSKSIPRKSINQSNQFDLEHPDGALRHPKKLGKNSSDYWRHCHQLQISNGKNFAHPQRRFWCKRMMAARGEIKKQKSLKVRRLNDPCQIFTVQNVHIN